MSYLTLLQQIRQQPDIVQRLGSGIGQFAQASIADARERAKLEQANIQAMLSAGQTAEAAKRVANLREDLRTGYGMNLPTGPVRGTPITKPLQGPPVPPAMRAGMRPELATPQFFERQVGESFETPEARRAVYAGAMLPQPAKPDLVRVGNALYDPSTGKFIQPPVEMMQPKMGFVRQPDGSEVYTALTPGTISAPAPRAPREPREREPKYTWITMPDGTRRRVEDRPGLVSAAPALGYAQDPETGMVYPVATPRKAVPAGTPAAPPPSKPGPSGLTTRERIAATQLAEKKMLALYPGAGTVDMLYMQIGSNPQMKSEFDSIVAIEEERAAAAKRPAGKPAPATTPPADAFGEALKLLQQQEEARRKQAGQK